MKKISIVLLVAIVSFAIYKSKYTNAANETIPLVTNLFEQAIGQGALELKDINEASGLAASRSNSKAYWTHNDSGGINRLFLLTTKGVNLGSFILEGIKARDWEDMSIGVGPKSGINYLYVADIGDNRAQYDEKVIYRFPEPDVSNITTPKVHTISKKQIDIIRFQYPDGKRDAETLMVDPQTKDLIIISKREKKVHMYIAPYPQSLDKINILKKVGVLDFQKIVAGDISPNGNEIILKDYNNIYYWKKTANESIEALLKSKPKRLPYIPEPQGEAIAWALDGNGFYTLSEASFGIDTQLYFFKRK
ncbi:hypothetical protein [Pseudoalteromonas denitrificans]|uniref:Integral membrane protein n=1 Tax=Pseudoalteromonas denitrificans DSM 6059 TaxID=1123010 RepID=A0A1I1J259_9GAMM|nr:hypothetical protein [Pseudoalteromonas denitrificans]SFC42689.1 hypothetical protein SAMN02745724_01630 [Pseudoalteromonas denitrificans DSM 6059]